MQNSSVGNPVKRNSASTKKVLRKAAIETLESRLLLSGNPTWQVQSDYFGATSSVSQPRSLRGLALSPSGADVYGGFIQGNGNGSDSVREVSTAIQTNVIGNDFNTLAGSTPDTTGEDGIVNTVAQAKGVATDDRGNVYATLSNGANNNTQQWAIYNSSLTTQIVKETSTDFVAARTLSDIATAKIGGNYYVYVGWQNGQIERWNVNNPALPALDTSWGLAAHPGTISLKAINSNAYLNGLTIAGDGTIYVAGGIAGDSNAFGDSLLEIPAAVAANATLNASNTLQTFVFGGASGAARSVSTEGSMHLALYGGKIYVTEYLNSNSTIGVFYQSNLGADGIITPPNPTGPSGLNAAFANNTFGADCGYSGIAISSTGQIYLGEQEYNQVVTGSYSPNGGTALNDNFFQFDRIMVSSALDTAGPVVSNVALSANNLGPSNSTPITLTAAVDDSTTGGSVITGAQYSLNGGSTWLSMAASDGAFDRPTENVTATFTIPGAGLTAGQYTILVRGTDAAGFTGANGSVVLTVTGPIHNTEGGQFSTIQAAVNGSPSGDTITIDPGTYNETVTIADQLTLVSSTGSVNVTAFVLNSGENVSASSNVTSASIAVDSGATINDGVLLAATGGTVSVAAGTFNQQVTVNKSISLLGANAGIHPAVGANTPSTVGTRGAETILSHNGLYAISPQATNITIDGFEFTGTGSREIDVTSGNISNLHLTNNIFADTATSANAGVVNLVASTATGVTVDYNSFVNRGGGYSFYAGLGDFDGIRIANNYFNGGAESVFWAAATPTGAVITNNEFDGTIGGVSGAGDPLLNIGAGGNIHIDDNYFHDMNYTAFQVGIVGGEVVGNTFQRMSPLSGGPFGDDFQLWGGEFGTAVSTNVNISQNILYFNDNATYPTRGVRLRAQDSGSMAPGIDGTTIHINDNTFINDGVLAAGNGANAITFQGDQTKPVDASGNWWSTTSDAAIANLMVGPVDFTPYLNSGANSETVGFQGNFSTLDVTPLGAQVQTGGRINEAVNDLTSGGTINVASGSYVEDVSINKPLTLLGAQNGVDARGRSATESTLTSSDGGIAISVAANNVTVNGLHVVDGLLQASGSNLTIIDNLFNVNASILSASNTGSQAGVIGLGTVSGAVTVSQNSVSITGALSSGGYSLAPLSGQQGWSGGAQADFEQDNTTSVNADGSIGDEAITSAASNTGGTSWRYSRGYGTPGQGSPYSPTFGATAGPPSTGATGDTMTSQFSFKAVAPGDGSSQSVYEGPPSGDDRTGANIYLSNAPGGVQLYMYAWDNSIQDTIQVPLLTVAAGSWHSVKMVTVFHNDPTLDTTTYTIDGAVVTTQEPWPNAYRASISSPLDASARLKWTSFDQFDLTKSGFYYDDVSLQVTNSGNPSVVLGSYATSFGLTTPAQLDGISVTGNASALTTLNIANNTLNGGNADPATGLTGSNGINVAPTTDAGAVTVQGNAVTGFVRGITAGASATTLAGATTAINFNTIDGDITGVRVDSATGPSVANNLIFSDQYGIYLGSSALSNGLAMTVVDNSIAGNTVAGLDDASTTPVTAVKNWWGSTFGPSISLASPPKGDVVIGSVTVSPWRESGHNNVAAGATGFLPDAFAVGPATSFAVLAPHAAAQANAFAFTVTALDSFGDPATGYGGLVHFTSTSPGLLPSNATLTNGVGVFSAVLNNLGAQTITATDMTTSSITGISGTITVYRGTFDFGTSASPVALNYNGVNPATTFTTPQGYGWQSGSVSSFDTGYTTNSLGLDPSLVRDFNYSANATFAVNLPNGLYDVTLTLGDDRGFAYPQTVSFGGVVADTLTTGGSNPAAIAKTYVVGVLNGQLQIGIGAAVAGTYGVIDGVAILPDTSSFAIASSTPANGSTAFGPINQMSIIFNHPIGANATIASNYSITGPGGLSIASVVANGPNGVTLNFSGSTIGGAYAVSVGAGILDAAGNALGATPAITFTQTIVTSGKYDFGTTTSPVAAGYTPISPASAYVPALGYGWQSGPNTITGFDTGVTAYTNPDVALTRDYDYTLGSTFTAAVGNGLYDVTLTLGDARGYAYTQNISFGGALVDTVNTGGSNPAVVSKTYVVGVTNGQLNLGIAGVGGGFGVLDGMSFAQDATTFAVTSASPASGATIFGPVSQLTVTFDHPLGANATNTSNYSLSGPGGLTIVSATPVIGANAITLNLSGSTSVGAYMLTIGAGIQDAVNATLGTPDVVSFTESQLTTGKFDFGTATSPVAASYSQITPASAFSVSQGYGWLSGPNAIGSFDTANTSFTTPDANLTRDYDYTLGSTFAANVANGLYDVTVTLGDARNYAYPQTVSFGGTLYDTLTTGGSNAAVITKTYVVGVTGGQLDVGLAGVGGGFAVVDGLSFVPDSSAFTVASSTPAAGSTSFGPVSQMSVTFSHPVGAAALVKTNYSLSGPGSLTISNVTQVNASTVNLTFSAPTTTGSYTLTIGSGVVDVAGNALTSSNMIAFSQGILVSGAYDFGSATSPVATGYTQITPTTAFTPGLGYGWLSGAIGALDTGITTFTSPDPNVTRDFNYSTNGTFAANVPNGLYDVTLVLGDARQYTYPQTISFGGVATDTVTTGSSTGAILVKTYVVGVTSGQLDVGIAAAAGGTFGVIDGLSFTPDTTTFALASSSPAANQTAYGNVTSMTVTYNHPIGASALVATNYTLNGTAGVGVASVTQNTASSVTLNFSGRATSGVYSLGITANVKDSGGNAIAATTIPFTTAVITSASYAFEPPASPNPIGYTAVTPSSQFNNVAGYGWATNNVMAFDTGVINTMSSDPNLNREFNYTTNNTFSVVVANGTYNVSLALGDARGYSYTMGINFQSGTGPQDAVTTGGSNGAIVNKTYTVTVTNGILNLTLTGATNSFAVISGMVITPM